MDDEEDTSKFSLGEPATDFYQRGKQKRQSVIDKARRLADITIPSVFPEEGYETGEDTFIPNQSFTAFCVNTLASKLMLTALPPGRPNLKYNPIEHKLQEEIAADPELWGKIKLSLSRREESHRERLEVTKARSAYVKRIKLGLITGNWLDQWIDIDTPIVHNMHNYVVKRDAKGNQLVVVLHEEATIKALDPDIQEIAKRTIEAGDKTPEWDQTVDVYTVCKLDDDGPKKVWLYWQEIDGEKLEDTESESPFDNPPLYAGWLIPVYGKNWGESYCGEYQGDLLATENFAAADQDGAAASAFTLFFVKPGSSTSYAEVKKAENLEVLVGDAADVTVLRVDKAGDFQKVSNSASEAARRLASAFLLNSSIRRDAERVTAEEWRIQAKELDEAMGGLYSDIAQTSQRWFVLRFVHLHELDDKTLPPLPEGIISLGVVTGLDSIGRVGEGDRLMSFATKGQAAIGQEQFAMRLKVDGFLRQLAASESVKPEGILKTDDELNQEMQQAEKKQQQKVALEAAAPAIAQEGAKAVGDQIRSQAVEQQ